MLLEYFFFFIVLIIAFTLAIVLFLVSYLLILRNPYLEKISPYECGFNPFADARNNLMCNFICCNFIYNI